MGYGGWGGYHGGMHTTNVTNEYNTTNNITNNDNDVTNNTTNNEIAEGSELPGAVENNDGGFSSEPQPLQQEFPPEQQYDSQQVRCIILIRHGNYKTILIYRSNQSILLMFYVILATSFR